MKPLLLGAVLALLVLVFGLPSSATVAVSTTVPQPVILAFAAGLYARPHLARRGWLR